MSTLIDRINFNGRNNLPVIQQTEAAECGLACMAMVAAFYGHHIDLHRLRQQHRISIKGSTLKGLTQVAAKLGFTHRAIKCDLDSLEQLKTPCILHWNMDHFVVLKKVSKKQCVIHDPASGARTVSFDEVSANFTGVALELSPSHGFTQQKETPQARLSSFWSNLEGWKQALLTVFIYSMILQVFILATPIYMQVTVDEVLIANDTNLLNILAIGFGAILLMQTLSTALRSLLIMLLGNQMSLQMNANLVNHLFKLPMDYFEKRHIGDVVSRFRSLESLKNLLTTTLIESLVDGICVIGLLVMMYLYSVELMLLVLLASSLYLCLRTISYRKLRNVNRDNIIATARKDSNFMESVRGMQSIKLFTKESDRLNLFNNYNVESANTSIKVERLRVMFSWTNMLIFGLENILVIYLGANMVMDAILSVGMMLAFVSYKTQFEQKVANLIDKFIEFKMCSLHLERLGDITLTEQEQDLGEQDDEFQVTGALSLNNIHFSYSDEDVDVLNNVSLQVNPGESIAIVGPSGCGKSTLMKVMLGLLKPHSGTIKVDSRDIRKSGLINYRNQVASVMQNDQLLSGTILENITFFCQQPDREWAEECAKLAGIAKDIQSLPMGYRSLIGDMGSSLSGGQAQRLLLARALYKKPKILFLDEATSSLDLAAEQHVNKAIRMLNITRVMIAHRPQTIMSADRIIRFAKGECIEISKDDYRDRKGVPPQELSRANLNQ
ncbi:peptidase domain-containing ABC transporter [Shewanella sp. NIFS-20-20]|uniref:peptidase domain-containing ABC transporter n=1 Tax=Shewanella sp. NIFS-20-20 TaxID=2853806 RepID=UPI001C45B74A|nr:peptidase domain-containing ABC transporter [Shewanella sp. NIFS-20-20]MBV7314956.1 peptidase domain-containing ABC transporter [Shewanella sp. NIFS-20-20]